MVRDVLKKTVDFLFDDRDPIGTLYVVGGVVLLVAYLGVKSCDAYKKYDAKRYGAQRAEMTLPRSSSP